MTPFDIIAGLLLLPVFLRPGLASCGGVGWKRGPYVSLSFSASATKLFTPMPSM